MFIAFAPSVLTKYTQNVSIGSPIAMDPQCAIVSSMKHSSSRMSSQRFLLTLKPQVPNLISTYVGLPEKDLSQVFARKSWKRDGLYSLSLFA